MAVADGATLAFGSKLFAGAKKVTLLDSYGETLGLEKFDRAIDFGRSTLTKPFFYAINWLNSLLGTWLAVIAFTVVVKIFFPLAGKPIARCVMRLVSPKIQQIRNAMPMIAGDDRETMDLHKKDQPAAYLLVLLQIPVFFAL